VSSNISSNDDTMAASPVGCRGTTTIRLKIDTISRASNKMDNDWPHTTLRTLTND
jgi:hypothetical protein